MKRELTDKRAKTHRETKKYHEKRGDCVILNTRGQKENYSYNHRKLFSLNYVHALPPSFSPHLPLVLLYA